MKLGIVASCFLLVAGCAFWNQKVRPQLSSADEIARVLCAVHFAAAESIPVPDALEKFCSLQQQWSPWLNSGQPLRVEVELEAEAAGGSAGE